MMDSCATEVRSGDRDVSVQRTVPRAKVTAQGSRPPRACSPSPGRRVRRGPQQPVSPIRRSAPSATNTASPSPRSCFSGSSNAGSCHPQVDPLQTHGTEPRRVRLQSSGTQKRRSWMVSAAVVASPTMRARERADHPSAPPSSAVQGRTAVRPLTRVLEPAPCGRTGVLQVPNSLLAIAIADTTEAPPPHPQLPTDRTRRCKEVAAHTDS